VGLQDCCTVPYRNKAVIDIGLCYPRLCPRCCPEVSYFEYTPFSRQRITEPCSATGNDHRKFGEVCMDNWIVRYARGQIDTQTIGATTAEKLEGTSSGVDADPLPFPRPSLLHLPLLNSTPVSPIPFHTLFFPWNTARRFGEIC